MDYLETMKNDLTCPITLDLFVDPITVSCCGKAFDRLALIQHFDSSYGNRCPLCNQNLDNFDAVNAPKNVTITSMLESFLKLQSNSNSVGSVLQNDQNDQNNNNEQWSCDLVPLMDNLDISELQISLENAKFVPRPSLFIAVVDRSGSMGGFFWKQVETALIHIMSLNQSNTFVKTVIVAYDSFAEIINTSGTQADVTRVIKSMFTGGGTNFNAAFDKIKDVLSKYVCSDVENMKNAPNNVSNVTVAFLTDGEATSDRNVLVSTFRQILKDNWTGPISVHSIGFGRNCDRIFLEDLWKTGNINGSFRYAEPEDNGDTLCGKLTNLFDSVSAAATVQISLELDKCTFKTDNKLSNQSKNKTVIQFPINEQGKGKYTLWVNSSPELGNLIINSNSIYPIVKKNVSNDAQKLLFSKWIVTLIDDLATDTLSFSAINKTTYGMNLFNLHLGLIQQRIDTVKNHISQNASNPSFQRLEIIQSEINAIKAGTNVNKGKLGDLRFGNQYIASTAKTIVQAALPTNNNNALPQQPAYAETLECTIGYSRNNDGKNRNELQQAIMNCIQNKITDKMMTHIDTFQNSYFLHDDVDGNNTLMLAAYCGNSCLVQFLLEKFPEFEKYIHRFNNYGESALTMAIKKRGFWKTVELLLNYGAEIPKNRQKGLEQYCINNKYTKCADVISKHTGTITSTVNDSMTAESIKFIYERAIKNNLEIDFNAYMKICLSKCAIEMVKKLVETHHIQITPEMLFESCVADSPNHVNLCKYLLEQSDFDINQKNSEKCSLLFSASEKGSLGHVKLFLSKKNVIVDSPNALGNTPLWIACCNRYIDIVGELLNAGANVNYANLKGNTPLVPVCQRGPENLAEILLAAGATVDQLNNNGDSVILLCCRNGQAGVLKLLLNVVSPEILCHAAHIDGFSPILAATESNKIECIKVLVEHGIEIEQKTANDNPILAGATALHLAAYYGRVESARLLLQLGANCNATDVNQCTALHIAVMQNQTEIVKLLKYSNINCFALDNLGYTALSYCRSNDEIKQILINPIYNLLISLARGEFKSEEEKIACDLLLNHSGAIGCLSTKDAVDIIGQDGKTPLMEAIIHSTTNVIQTLLTLGADPTKTNLHGINSFVWSEWINNTKVKTLLQNFNNNDVSTFVQRLKSASTQNTQNAMTLYLASKPKILQAKSSSEESGIYVRMNNFVNDLSKVTIPESIEEENTNIFLIDFFDKNAVTVFNEQNLTKNILWDAKIFTSNIIAAGITNLNPQQIMAIYLYTTNTNLSRLVNNYLLTNDLKIMKTYVKYLWESIKLLPYHIGEVFRGITYLENRKSFLPGTEISWPGFTSASTIWRIATENTKDFSTKKREGTIFLIKSQTGRYIGQYSQFPQDTEILFLPDTKFKVSSWYMGDVIALGQANIRHSTFKIRPEDMDKIINTNTGLIIELEEVASNI